MPPLGHHTVNSHDLSIALHYDAAGAQKEVELWCHTCDPEGEGTRTYDLRTINTATAIIAAQRAGEYHASDYPIPNLDISPSD